MPKVGEMLESKFLRKEDFDIPKLLTVAGVVQENVAMAGAEPEMKWCLQFQETEKPLVLNSTNIQLCAKAFGSDDTDEWIGRQIVLYHEPHVSYGGKLVGGIRVRAPKVRPVRVIDSTQQLSESASASARQSSGTRPRVTAKTPIQQLQDMDDEVPF